MTASPADLRQDILFDMVLTCKIREKRTKMTGLPIFQLPAGWI